MSTEPGGGGYITRGRALELERMIAASEARLQERIDAHARELAEIRAGQDEWLRTMVGAGIDLLRSTSATPPSPTKEPR